MLLLLEGLNERIRDLTIAPLILNPSLLASTDSKFAMCIEIVGVGRDGEDEKKKEEHQVVDL